jgi:tRNA modification GTPase
VSPALDLDQPIAALASAPGPSARGILRLSGQNILPILEACFEPEDAATWRSSRSARQFSGRLMLSNCSVSVACLLCHWPTSRSYTGQPLAEFHLPGSPPLLERVLEELYRHGVRPARPGEFTLRAFLAGKLDLVQAEAVLGVVDAHDDVELRLALEQLAGGISNRLLQLRQDLIELLADLEAGLDFVEEDIEFVSRNAALARLATARQFVASLLDQSDSRMTSSTRPKVVLAGLPNAGKSTLFNVLAGESLALVSSERGTTRDYLRAELTWQGVGVELIDTAGWEATELGISGVAQSQRADQFERADLILWCSACNQDELQHRLDDAAFKDIVRSATPVLRIGTKADQLSLPQNSPSLPVISAQTGDGLEALREALIRALSVDTSQQRAWLGMTAARCRESLTQAREALCRSEQAALVDAAGDELIAVDLREALDHLGAIVGAVYTDDLLDRIFSKFCIGK